MIYHVTTKTDWQTAKDKGYYEAASLATEGFIHLSTKEQVAGVLERYYKGQADLLLRRDLKIEKQVGALGDFSCPVLQP